jgi:hypothetical protein
VEEVAAALLQEELEKRYTEEIQEAEEEYRTATREGRTEDALRAVEEMRRQPTIADPTGVAISAGLITENEGISYREYWYADLESPGSLMDLVKAVAAGDAPLEFLAIDTKVVGEWVRRQKSAFNYPGLKSWCEKGVAVN